MKKKSVNRSAFFNLRALLGLMLCIAGVALAFFAFSKALAQQGSRGSASGKEPSSRLAQYRGVAPVVRFDVSPPLRNIKPIPPGPGQLRENEDRDIVPRRKGVVKPDPVVQSTIGREPAVPGPVVSFDGQSNLSAVAPPDPNGAVGPNHVVAMANLSFQIFNKSGTSLFGPAANNTLWAGFGGPCQTENSGDPVVLYDQLADRWLLSQFTSAGPTFFNCIAVSTTPDPTGSYFRYAVSTGGNFPDYPKYGVWPDAYYISTREFLGAAGAFQGVGAYAINRAQVLAGNPSPQIISFLAPPTGAGANVGDGLLPSNLDGMTLPPPGSPNYYVGTMDDNGPYGAALDALTLWKFHVDFAVPGNSTFGMTDTLPTAAFNSILGLCGGTRACIPQPGTTSKIDHLGYRQRPLHRLAYRNFGDHESLVTNQSVSAGTGAFGEVSGIRWWELRSPNSSPVIYQEGTYAPGLTDGIHRWMGSIAMDGLGNMALGYSASSGSVFPSVFYTARHPGSPPGTMPLGEGSIINGTGSQTAGSNRWGDYTALSIDPTDDITFWYVNEYVPTTSASGWRLRIGSFRLIPAPALAASAATLSAEGCSPSNGTLDPGETVTVNFCVTNNGNLGATNVVGTLQNTGGVTAASGPQTYGPIAPGATVCKSFTFTASGTCGGMVTASIQLQDGPANLGTATYVFTMTGTVTTSFSENFDAAVVPALPAGWTADRGINTAGAPLWVTSNSGTPTPVADSAPNAVFTQDPNNVCDNRIYSPVLTYTAGSQLTFRQNYDLEENSPTTAYDAGVLEISINGAAFTDIVSAGGSFATGGYNHTGINTTFGNPLLPSRPCWSGVSGGFVSVAVNLPAAGVGQSVQFRWRMGSDNGVSHTGWRVDNVAIAQRTCSTNCTAPTVSTAVSRKNHGGDDFDVPLPLTGDAGIECRTGGATNDYQMVVTFGAAVSVTGSPQAQVTSGTGIVGSGGVGNGGAVSVSGNTVTIPLTNVANAQTILVTLNGVSDGSTTGNVAVPMSRLLGDTNANGIVNSSDVTLAKSQLGQVLGVGNFRSDVNVSGGINSTDVTLIKGAIPSALP